MNPEAYRLINLGRHGLILGLSNLRDGFAAFHGQAQNTKLVSQAKAIQAAVWLLNDFEQLAEAAAILPDDDGQLSAAIDAATEGLSISLDGLSQILDGDADTYTAPDLPTQAAAWPTREAQLKMIAEAALYPLARHLLWEILAVDPNIDSKAFVKAVRILSYTAGWNPKEYQIHSAIAAATNPDGNREWLEFNVPEERLADFLR